MVPGDIDYNGYINSYDLKTMAGKWLEACIGGDFCGGADLSGILGQTANPGTVDFKDLAILADKWLNRP